MIGAVVFLALVAYASAGMFNPSEPWKEGFCHTVGKNEHLPQNVTKAEEEGYEMLSDKGGRLPGYEHLQLWGNPKKFCIALLFDASGIVVGIQINIPVSKIVPYWKMEDQGAELWTSDFTGTETDYYVTQVIIKKSEDVKFKHGSELVSMPWNLKNMHSDWKKQACMILMGTHFYNNMTTTTTCDKPFPHVFGLGEMNTDQLIGIGIMFLGDCPNLDCFENPDTMAVKMIVKDGPQCLYDLVKKHKACTLHIFFIDNPYAITCPIFGK